MNLLNSVTIVLVIKFAVVCVVACCKGDNSSDQGAHSAYHLQKRWSGMKTDNCIECG